MNKFFSMLIAALLLLACAVFFTTCKKEYSYEGGALNAAIFTLSGAGGTCTGSLLSGSYYAGIQLTTVNAIQLQVYVTTTGTYNVNTGSVNGFYFSTSGTFADTGIQQITLLGIGKPVSTGDFIFTVPVGERCSFTVPISNMPVIDAGFTLAGAPNDCESAAVNGSYVVGVKLNNSNFVQIHVDVISNGPYTLNTDTLDGISFSASGTFTATGNQMVTLVGSGTPDLPRNLMFTLLAGTSHCTFAVSVINPQPLATYVLESGGGGTNSCIYTLSGTYASNTPLSNSNTVSVRVYVSELGNFTIATNTVNGISFSYTGSFTATGSQNVILNGDGTPAAQGVYTFIPEIVGPHPIGGEACAFNVEVL